ncbi:unnamed protein product [Linum tenue]|nr:unnamed protein product [Linum tenue]
MKETPEAHVFKADVSCLEEEEVKVEVEEGGRVLQIIGEQSKEHKEKTNKWHRVEHNNDKFMRRFRLPNNTKVDQEKAAMENGVLTVPIPKEEEKKPRVKNVHISS